jgi:hypothetical protein
MASVENDRFRPSICDDGEVTEATAPVQPDDFDCPRCGTTVTQAFYGPCDSCRDQLRATMGNEQRQFEVTEYEPKMNVTPNHVATKE